MLCLFRWKAFNFISNKVPASLSFLGELLKSTCNRIKTGFIYKHLRLKKKTNKTVIQCKFPYNLVSITQVYLIIDHRSLEGDIIRVEITL